MNCQRCGAPLTPGNAFCGGCGAPAAAAAPAQPQQYQQPAPPPMQGGYPPQQYQQYQQYQQPQQYQQYQQPAPPPPMYGAQQPAYGAPVGYQPVGAPIWVLFGYLFSLMGGFIGIGIGGMLWGSKVDDPFGNKVKKYKGSTRTHGFIILVLGAVMFAVFTQMAG